jgi:hypothetical protein
MATTNQHPIFNHLIQQNMKKLIVLLALVASLSVTAQDNRPLCAGKTKAGIACKNHAQDKSSYCGMHNPNAARCGFVKKDGNKCQMRVKVTGSRCHHHAGK